MRIRALVPLLLFAAAPVDGQIGLDPPGTRATTVVEEAIGAFDAGDLEKASRLFHQAVDHDLAPGDAREYVARFYLGLILQQQAAEPSETRRAELLAAAAAQYERALVVDPQGGGALNNLAQVYADLGSDADARRLFEQAMALHVSLRPFYLRNYADFLASRGEWPRAAELYRETLNEEPEDRQAHDSLMVIYAQHEPDRIPDYLWFLIARGRAIWVQETAVERLTALAKPEESEIYLTLLVAALAGQARLPGELHSTQETDVLAATVLTTLSADPGVDEGAREVLRLHEANELDEPASYGWWAERGRTAGNAEGELSPRQAFRKLIRSLGDAQRKTKRFESARQYLRLSVLLTREEPDLEAFRMMLSLPPEAQDMAALGRLAQWNEDVLRQVTPEWGDLYLYRHDLGLLYSFLPDAQKEGPATALYQLEKAIEIDKNQQEVILPPDGPPDTPTFDALLWTRLAAQQQPEQARQTLYDLIDAYNRHGLHDEADLLLAMLQGGRRRRPPERQRDVLDDPPGILRDFTTEPPEPPQ